MKTGEKIAKARKDINLTQDQLAELLEVTRQTIFKWESDLAFPETAKISKLAEVLKVSCDYLLRDDKQYHRIFTEMIKEMMTTYNYSLDDTILVLKDLLYKAYLDMQKEEK